MFAVLGFFVLVVVGFGILQIMVDTVLDNTKPEVAFVDAWAKDTEEEIIIPELITITEVRANLMATDHPVYGSKRVTHVKADYDERAEWMIYSDIEETVVA